jgi:hypothetical protein
VLPAREARDHAPGLYRVFDPFTDKYVGFSITEEYARRLIHMGLVECVCTQKLTDDRVVFLHWHFSEVSVEALLLAGRLLANRL